MQPNTTYLGSVMVDEVKEVGNPSSEWLLLESQRSFAVVFEDTMTAICRLAECMCDCFTHKNLETKAVVSFQLLVAPMLY
jgi:hypothetical protein